MSWFSRKEKREPKREPRKLYIPEEAMARFYELYDAYHEHERQSDRYALWKFIYELFPEDDMTNARWRANTDSIFKPVIEEVI